MKKNSIIFYAALISLSLAAYGFISSNNTDTEGLELATNEPSTKEVVKKVAPDFLYDLGTRFNSIKKEELDKVTTFADFIAEEHASRIVSYKSLDVIILRDGRQTGVRVDGIGGEFNEAQIEFLQSLPYSTDIKIWADYTEHEFKTGDLQESHWTPHLTIVPEKQALYRDGKDALIKYLRENSKEETAAVRKNQLKPGKLHFTVTKTGTITNVRVEGTSGYASVDEALIKLITETSGIWQPAENVNGEKVNQELVISFGSMGC